jgi:hypothetical protein
MITSLILAGLSFVAGMFALLFYILLRMLRSDGWDRSNLLNALRLLSHVAIHPEDFQFLQYPDGRKPFGYIGKDEFSENFPDARP